MLHPLPPWFIHVLIKTALREADVVWPVVVEHPVDQDGTDQAAVEYNLCLGGRWPASTGWINSIY